MSAVPIWLLIAAGFHAGLMKSLTVVAGRAEW